MEVNAEAEAPLDYSDVSPHYSNSNVVISMIPATARSQS